jgi:hypothetical protein
MMQLYMSGDEVPYMYISYQPIWQQSSMGLVCLTLLGDIIQ